jgi:hypothetical protein
MSPATRLNSLKRMQRRFNRTVLRAARRLSLLVALLLAFACRARAHVAPKREQTGWWMNLRMDLRGGVTHHPVCARCGGFATSYS